MADIHPNFYHRRWFGLELSGRHHSKNSCIGIMIARARRVPVSNAAASSALT